MSAPGSDDTDWRPGAGIAALHLRARLNATLRAFFAARGVLEVETPILSAAGTTDRHIESFHVDFDGPARAGARRRWLRTSPEFALKRLLAAGVGDCYELGRVFRNGEAGGRHNPEFSMLEWYRVGWDHHRLMGETAELIGAALALVGRHCRVRRIAYRDLFQDQLGLDPLTAPLETLQSVLAEVRIDPAGLDRDDWLDLIISHRLQPHFDPDTLLLLYDYPASQCALARLRGSGDSAVAERFEAYLGPLELANGYHELTDAAEQARRFDSDIAARRAAGRDAPPADARLLAAMAHGLPACAGVALGVDRLLLCLLGDSRGAAISAALAFDFGRA
ncbi:MAG: EF-P lysine aminoacylase EpmA [Lysobacteraceae bacterium]